VAAVRVRALACRRVLGVALVADSGSAAGGVRGWIGAPLKRGRRHELTRDGSTWYWWPEQETEGSMAGRWMPSLQCDGYIPSIDGAWFNTEAECQAWIDEAAKASPVPPVRVDGRELAFDRVTIPQSDLSDFLGAAALLATAEPRAPFALRTGLRDLLARYGIPVEVD
jgi:hypothetical protein